MEGRRYFDSIDEGVKPFQKARYLLFLRGRNVYFVSGVVYGRYNLDGKDRSEENLFRWANFEQIRKVARERFKER
ncbi:hypothetical protein [Leptolyngbya sp. AN10]|uniref:hypothetical protein n=1 Tax=Leptolyngbya sp. AN10 TaxID=3423365 RepID=UPI003D32067F